MWWLRSVVYSCIQFVVRVFTVSGNASFIYQKFPTTMWAGVEQVKWFPLQTSVVHLSNFPHRPHLVLTVRSFEPEQPWLDWSFPHASCVCEFFRLRRLLILLGACHPPPTLVKLKRVVSTSDKTLNRLFWRSADGININEKYPTIYKLLIIIWQNVISKIKITRSWIYIFSLILS